MGKPQPSLQLLFHWPPPLTSGWGVWQFQQVLSGVASEMRQSPHGELFQCLSTLWSFRRAVAVALANDPFPQLGELRCINTSIGVIVAAYGDHVGSWFRHPCKQEAPSVEGGVYSESRQTSSRKASQRSQSPDSGQNGLASAAQTGQTQAARSPMHHVSLGLTLPGKSPPDSVQKRLLVWKMWIYLYPSIRPSTVSLSVSLSGSLCIRLAFQCSLQKPCIQDALYATLLCRTDWDCSACGRIKNTKPRTAAVW